MFLISVLYFYSFVFLPVYSLFLNWSFLYIQFILKSYHLISKPSYFLSILLCSFTFSITSLTSFSSFCSRRLQFLFHLWACLSGMHLFSIRILSCSPFFSIIILYGIFNLVLFPIFFAKKIFTFLYFKITLICLINIYWTILTWQALFWAPGNREQGTQPLPLWIYNLVK